MAPPAPPEAIERYQQQFRAILGRYFPPELAAVLMQSELTPYSFLTALEHRRVVSLTRNGGRPMMRLSGDGGFSSHYYNEPINSEENRKRLAPYYQILDLGDGR